jgi:hypothetical protein
MKKRLLPGLMGLVVACMMAGIQPASLSAANTDQADCMAFQETGKSVCGKFLAYWKAHGAVAQQGFPISGEFREVSDIDGKPYTVQYFERAVFELHPEKQAPYDVLLSLLGSMAYKQRYPNGAQELPPDMRAEAGITFPETGKTVRGVFLTYWQKNGGLAQQGFPLTNLIMEKSALDGKEYVVQYFERAVFELHPQEVAPYNVLLSQLGTLRFKQKYPNGVGGGSTQSIQAGTWGGTDLRLEAAADGNRFEFGCAHGAVPQPITLDAKGNFDVVGEFVYEHGGPVSEYEIEDKHPARYTGTVTDGSIMVVTVTITDENKTFGPYKLTLGTPGKVIKCL